jgi:hypothetical protein
MAKFDGADSAIKWAHPTWSLSKEPVCYLKGASKHVTFGFWKGASIDDPSGRLETSGEVMATRSSARRTTSTTGSSPTGYGKRVT